MKMNHLNIIKEKKKLYAADWQRAIDATVRWKDEWKHSVVATPYDKGFSFNYTKQECMDGG